jgi:hypothetical protein
MTETSLKNQAQEIMATVDRELELQQVESTPPALQAEIDTKANALMNTIFGAIHDVDIAAAAKQVQALKEKYPQASQQELAQKLIYEKCRRTGTVGAVTSSVGIIPGVGTAAALILGTAADIGVTFKLDAELVLEIAAVYNYPLTEAEKQRVVLLISGLSAGASALAVKAGRSFSIKVGEKFAEKTVVKALPVIGVIASVSTNALSTYIIGQRADAYFRLGPEAVGTWADSLRAISGVDERRLRNWLAEGSKTTGQAVYTGAVKATGAVGSGAKKAGQAAQSGVKAYIRFYVNFWRAIFRLIVWVLRFIWIVIMFIPRKIAGMFRRTAN